MSLKYMKKTILVFLSILLLSGCADFLDTSLDTNPTSETIETNRNTLWNLANAFYSPITYGYSVIDNNIFASASDDTADCGFEQCSLL